MENEIPLCPIKIIGHDYQKSAHIPIGSYSIQIIQILDQGIQCTTTTTLTKMMNV